VNTYVAATDPTWFDFLAHRPDIDEVNFWLPHPWGGRFKVLSPGEPLLFKLKRPYNDIAGGGYFAHYWEVPLSLAWDAFGEKNGAASLEEFRANIARLRHEPNRPATDPLIGCILLVEPFFWSRDLWLHDPPGFHRNTERGKTYDVREEDGKTIWDEVAVRLPVDRAREAEPLLEVPGGYFASLSMRRWGQGTFRALVTDTYRRRCAITHEKALPALEAAHIRRFRDVERHAVPNGILLRSDVHRLFDAGYITITPEYRVEASHHMKDDFDDGDNYLKLNGREIWVPDLLAARPDPEALRWHNENRYRG